MSRPVSLIHRFILVSVSAEAAACEIREVIPKWQPVLSDGFQGRQLLLLVDLQPIVKGVLGERRRIVAATGHDGQVRKYFERQEASAAIGEIAYRTIDNVLSVADVRSITDEVLSNAMPVSALSDIELALDFHVRAHVHLFGAQAERADLYQGAHIAPENVHVVKSTRRQLWTVHLTMYLAEQLYALLEVHGGAYRGVHDITMRDTGEPAVDVITGAFNRWSAERSRKVA